MNLIDVWLTTNNITMNYNFSTSQTLKANALMKPWQSQQNSRENSLFTYYSEEADFKSKSFLYVNFSLTLMLAYLYWVGS